jgi:ABC-2 type transport system permease protein
MEPVRLYLRLIAAQLRGQMHYRVSFLLALLGSFSVTLIEFAMVAVLFGRIRLLAGWSLPEVALCYGLSGTAFAVAEIFAAALDKFDVHIVQGTFDRVLVRPRSALLQVMADDFALRRVGRIAQALLVLVIATDWLQLQWTPDKLAVVGLALVSGTVIFFAIFVLGGAFCFWTVQGKEATHMFTYGGDQVASYPLDIYQGWLRRFFTFIVPLGFVNYYPSLYLLDRADPLGLPPVARLLSPAAAVLISMVAWFGWRLGIRHYQSTGS